MRGERWEALPFLWLLLYLYHPSIATSSADTSLSTCTTQTSVPIHYPISNVTLNDSIVRRGAAVSFGTPPQSFAFLLAATYDNTYLNDAKPPGCGGKNTRLYCSNQYGGLFDEGSSTTWSPKISQSTSDQDASDQDGNDTLLVSTTLSIPDVPLRVVRASAGTPNLLGLGRNSTWLDALVSAGLLASKTFSIFQGWTGDQTQYQTDGSLVIGGYDSAKITGDNITLPFTIETSCISGLAISVIDINMSLKNGSNVSIIGESPGSALRACIEPSVSALSLPEEIWWAFTNVTKVAEIGRSVLTFNWGGMIIPANGAYDGDLTISIYPGLDITIPDHQLVVPIIAIDPEGQNYRPNSTIVEVLINSFQSAHTNYMPTFGMPFLSSAYLIVDLDKQQFTLSRSQQSSTSNIIAISPPSCNTPAPSPPSQHLPSVLASSTSALDPTPGTSSGAPKGAIAGAVVGGVAIISICAGLFLFRRNRRQVEKQNFRKMAEVDKSRHLKSEMPTERDDAGQGMIPIYELPDTSK